MADNENKGIMILEIQIQQLSCPLEEDELLEFGNELSKVVKEIEAEELTQKAAKSAMKDKLDALADKVSKLATIVKNKAEIRPVEVKHKLDEHGMVVSVRSDTGEIINTRKAKPSELQRKIDIPPTEK